MLGDGTEVLTDSDDADMFDDAEDKEEEEKDDEALRKVAARENKGEDEEMKDITKSDKDKENAKVDSSPAKTATSTDGGPKKQASN